MNTILLQPTDVLFFRDGRPMSGSLSGHGAAWPLPHVISHAFHAALHRAELTGVHAHRRGRSGNYQETRDRKFGSLTTVGPFPVDPAGQWFFPRPADAGAKESTAITLLPIEARGSSSLPQPLCHPLGNTAPPSKEKVAAWWSKAAWQAYLEDTDKPEACCYKSDADFSATESTYGIAIDADTGTTEESKFYSASYLRLKEGWKLGTFAAAPDKDFQHQTYGTDLVRALLNGHGTEIIAGGQQRVCTATLVESANGALPLPIGKIDGFKTSNDGKHLVKWVLLTPAIWPQINDHPGGWLPSWIHHTSGQVMLKTGDTDRHAGEGRKTWRERVAKMENIPARLVAAITGKPLPVTGWALPNEADPDRTEGGAKSTHLAVPAGSVYYFECDTAAAAQSLAVALNWHGPATVAASVPLAEGTATATVAASVPLAETSPHTIRNRRSTLMGEKGFGLGVCGTWSFHTSP